MRSGYSAEINFLKLPLPPWLCLRYIQGNSVILSASESRLCFALRPKCFRQVFDFHLHSWPSASVSARLIGSTTGMLESEACTSLHHSHHLHYPRSVDDRMALKGKDLSTEWVCGLVRMFGQMLRVIIRHNDRRRRDCVQEALKVKCRPRSVGVGDTVTSKSGICICGPAVPPVGSLDHNHHHRHNGLVATTPSDVDSSSRTRPPSSPTSRSWSLEDEQDYWVDCRRNVDEDDILYSRPSDSDDNTGLESISEPDDLDLDDDDKGLTSRAREI
ncbi:hypothetical protein D9613_010203 [Agrocybe pediades]|uniref:Uncharacterized protein n=1 Tax=Agrocybe pediades TaxID=84607 RepID=A0A8H4QFL2_9AGAR|nr:hypothetical protein D9613_010203 [Agrocybe pediades]